MPDLISVIEALIASTFFNGRALMPRVAKMELALLSFCALCVGIGIFFLALALYKYLEGLYMPYIAALVSAAFIFGAALVVIALTALLQYKKTSRHQSAQEEFNKNIHALIKDICTELEGPVRENPKTSVAIAALAGLLAARRI